MTFADTLKGMLDGAIKNPLGALNNVNMVASVLKNATEKPEAALTGFLLSFAHAMGHELSTVEATTLSRMVVRTIKKSRRT